MAVTVGSVIIHMGVDTTGMSKINSAASVAARDFARIRNSAVTAGNDITKSFSTAGQTAAAFAGHMGGLGTTLTRAGQVLGSLNNSVLATGAAFGATAVGLSKFVQASDRMKRMENNLRTVTSGTSDLVDTQRELFEISQRSRAPLEGAVTLYARIARASDGLGLSQKNLLRITETVQKSFAIGGASTQEAMGAAVQLSQGIASNRFSGDEFRSVAENAPVLLREMATQLGVNIGKLREMAHAGELTGEVVTRAILGASTAIDEDFGKTISTIDQSMARLGNSLDQYVYNVDRTYSVSSSLASVLNSLADNFEDVADYASIAGLAVATFIAGRVGGSALRTTGSALAGGLFAKTKMEARQQLEEIRSTLTEISNQRKEIERQIKDAGEAGGKRVVDMRLAQANALQAARLKEIAASAEVNKLTARRSELTKDLASVQRSIIDGLKTEQRESLKVVRSYSAQVTNAGNRFSRYGKGEDLIAQETAQRKLTAAQESYRQATERVKAAQNGMFDTAALRKYGNELKAINAALAANHKAQINAGQQLTRAHAAYLAAQSRGPEVIERTRLEMEKTAKTVVTLQAEQTRLNDLHKVTAERIGATERRLTFLGAASVRVGGFFRGMWGMLGGGPGVALMGIIGTFSALQIASANSAREVADFKQKLVDLGYVAPEVKDNLLDINKAAEEGKWVELREELSKTEAVLKRLRDGDWWDWIPLSGAQKGMDDDILGKARAILQDREFFAGTLNPDGEAGKQVAIQAAAAKRFLEIAEAVYAGKEGVSQFDAELQKLAQQFPELEKLVILLKEIAPTLEGAAKLADDLAKGVDKATKVIDPSQAEAEAKSLEKLAKMREENEKFFSERSKESGYSAEKKALEDRTQAILDAAEKEELIITESEARKQAIREIAAEKSVKIEEGMADLRLDALASGLDESHQEIVKTARSLGVAKEDIEAFINALSSGDASQVPAIFRDIADALNEVSKNKFLNDLEGLRLDNAASELSAIDKELVAMAESAGISNQSLMELIATLKSGDLSKLPEELRQAREAIQSLAVGETMRNLQFDYEQMGRSPVDQEVYAKLREIGLDLNSIDGQRIADQIKLNDLVEKQIDLAEELGKALKSGLSTFLQDLFTGKDILDSIVGIGSKFASMNFDHFVDSIMGKEDNIFNVGKAKQAGKAMGVEIVKTVADNDNWAGLRNVTSGANLAGSVGSYTNARAAGTAIGAAVSPVLSKSLTPAAQIFENAAAELGTTAKDLATVISYETGGTFSTSIRGGAGNRHIGLIQFGPEEQRKYGAAIGQTLEQQMVAVVKYLKDRGFKPGMGLADLYSTINAGSPGRYGASDAANGGAWGTVQDKVLYQMEGHKKNADKLLGQIPGAVQTAAEKGTQAGSQKGLQVGLENVSAGMNGGAGGNGMAVAGGMLGAGLGGFSTGYQSANPGMGALGGAVQGWGAGASLAATLGMTSLALPVIGAVVGAVGGLIGGILGAKNKVKQARRELDKQMNAINNLLDIGFGRGMGSLQKQLSDYLAEVDKAVPLAWKAKDWDLVDELHQSWNSMFLRLRTDFYNVFDETTKAYSSGFGLEAPTMQGIKALSELREELRNMLADVRYFGETTIEKTGGETGANYEEYKAWMEATVAQAQESAKRMILAFIGGREEFTEYESAVMAVKGAMSVAQTALEELGMEAKAAAEALELQLVSALKKLQSAFIDDISGSIYELSDMGFFSDLIDTQKRYNDRLRDSAALGLSADLANMELALSLRSIAKEAKLTDSQITQLAAAFPELSAQLMMLIGINAEGADTAERLSEAETALEEAKANLRSAYQEEKSEIESTISRLKSFIESLKKFKDNLKLDDELSPLNPFEKFLEAQSQFRDISTRAKAGDEDAMAQLEEASRSYLEEAKSYFGSTEAYYAVWTEVNSVLDESLTAAEGQLDAAEKQLSALQKQVGKLVDIDDGVKGVGAAIAELNKAQAEYDAAKKADDAYKNSIFAQMLEVLKLQLAAQQAANSAMQTAQTASVDNYRANDPVANILKKYIGPNVDKDAYNYYSGVLNSGSASLSEIEADVRQHALNAVADMFRTILKKDPAAADSGFDYYAGVLTSGKASLADIEADLRKHAKAAGIGMAGGGLVKGGLPGIDSVLRMLMPGEFVMPALQTQRHYGDLLAMRSNSWSASNDNVSGSFNSDLCRNIERLIEVATMGFSQNVSATREVVGQLRSQMREMQHASLRRAS